MTEDVKELRELAQQIIKQAEHDPANVMMLGEVAPLAREYLLTREVSADTGDHALALARWIVDTTEANPTSKVGIVARAYISAADKIERYEEALREIAAFDDANANRALAKTGSYGSFDEPASVSIARAALAQP